MGFKILVLLVILAIFATCINVMTESKNEAQVEANVNFLKRSTYTCMYYRQCYGSIDAR